MGVGKGSRSSGRAGEVGLSLLRGGDGWVGGNNRRVLVDRCCPAVLFLEVTETFFWL